MTVPDPREKPTLSTEEAAAVFGISPKLLYRLVQEGTAPIEPLRLGRRILWPTAKVLAALGIEPPASSSKVVQALREQLHVRGKDTTDG